MNDFVDERILYYQREAEKLAMVDWLKRERWVDEKSRGYRRVASLMGGPMSRHESRKLAMEDWFARSKNETGEKKMDEWVDHPTHYNQIEGIECIDIIEHFNYNLGAVIKHVWRAGLKGDALEDLKKAAWYLGREIERRGSPEDPKGRN